MSLSGMGRCISLRESRSASTLCNLPAIGDKKVSRTTGWPPDRSLMGQALAEVRGRILGHAEQIGGRLVVRMEGA